VKSSWSDSISIGFSGARNSRVGTSFFDCKCVSLNPVVDVLGFLAVLSALSVGFRYRFLCSRNSSLDAGAVIVVLAVYP
jgi:hypothetical protein